MRLMRNTVILITSDHGEGLNPEEDHGHRYHGPNLYDEVMRVPLIFIGKGWEPQRVDTPVSLIDMTPTLVDLGGAPQDPEFRGISLVPWLKPRVMVVIH